ncbi:hypothetical protein IAR50_005394 [Cryptococcus sp. DSM 104548]
MIGDGDFHAKLGSAEATKVQPAKTLAEVQHIILDGYLLDEAPELYMALSHYHLERVLKKRHQTQFVLNTRLFDTEHLFSPEHNQIIRSSLEDTMKLIVLDAAQLRAFADLVDALAKCCGTKIEPVPKPSDEGHPFHNWLTKLVVYRAEMKVHKIKTVHTKRDLMVLFPSAEYLELRMSILNQLCHQEHGPRPTNSIWVMGTRTSVPLLETTLSILSSDMARVRKSRFNAQSSST